MPEEGGGLGLASGGRSLGLDGCVGQKRKMRYLYETLNPRFYNRKNDFKMKNGIPVTEWYSDLFDNSFFQSKMIFRIRDFWKISPK